ncbi:tetratricopeptide repeat protein [Actinosynnema sp. NPDC059797]
MNAAIAAGHAEAVLGPLTELWSAVPRHVDEGILRLLHECGVAMATRLPTSLEAARTLRRGTGVLRDHDHLPLAVLHGRHELAVHRRRDDNPDATASALLDLSRTYRAQGRLHKVVDCADQMLETYGRHHHTTGFTRTLAYLGTLMIEARRPDAAIKHLTRATDTNPSSDPRRLAECQALLSRACRLSGNHHTADRHLNRALATALGTDERTVRYVHELADGTRQLPPPTTPKE